MEVIKTLPAIFEEFSEQRRNSFLHAYETKQKNIPFVGTFCTYTPTEVIMASGAIPVGLCSFSDETIAEMEREKWWDKSEDWIRESVEKFSDLSGLFAREDG